MVDKGRWFHGYWGAGALVASLYVVAMVMTWLRRHQIDTDPVFWLAITGVLATVLIDVLPGLRPAPPPTSHQT